MTDADPQVVAWRLAADLARARGEEGAAAAIARAASLLSDAEAVRVWMIDRQRGYRFAGAWPEQGLRVEEPPDSVARAVIFGVAVTAKGPGRFRSSLVLPLLAGHRPLGGVELLERERAAGPFAASDAEALADLLKAADSALESIRAAASRERGRIEAVTRLTRLFDIGRSFAATLEKDDLLRLIVNRVEAALEAEAVYLWLADEAGERLTVVAAAGRASELAGRWEIGPGEGVAGRVAATGEAALIDTPGEVPDLKSRPDSGTGLDIRSIVAAPIASEDGPLQGVLEVINPEMNGEAPGESELLFLREMAQSAALALGNARRLEAERRASDLGALLSAAQQLGSSLDLQKVTFALVHQAASVLRYRRASVGLFRGARLELAAISGQTFVDMTLPEMKALRDLLEWAAGLDDGTYVVQEEDGAIDTPRPETREKFRAYFGMAGSRSFLSVPLRDDEGRLGVFALEAADPYAFSGRALDAAGLLGAQATVAIRNAILFEQIPMARVFEPLARRKRQFLKLSWRRRLASAGALALAAAALVFVPVPLRVAGEARVLPRLRLPVTAEVEGRVAQVLVREGDSVEAGQVIALLDDTDYRVGHGDARARYQIALREQSRLRSVGRAADAAVEAARLEGLRADLDLWETRLERTRIRSAVSGTVATPRVEERVGVSLSRGDIFCDVIDPDRQEIEVAVPEVDAGLLALGERAKVKLNAFPTRSFAATVERIGVGATLVNDQRVVLARARLLAPGPALRSGMAGRAKIDTGPASIVRVLLRRPARWIWSAVWGWLP